MAFLAGLVDDLALDEAVAVSRRIEPRLRRDFLKELPLELALHCMSFVRLFRPFHPFNLTDH
jgi:F-box and WD-40 domain protein CDC4